MGARIERDRNNAVTAQRLALHRGELMYEPDSPEDVISKKLLNQIKQILADSPHPSVLSLTVSRNDYCGQSSVTIDVGNGHSLSLTLLEKTK